MQKDSLEDRIYIASLLSGSEKQIQNPQYKKK